MTISISYVTDAAEGGVGAFVDNVQVPDEEVEGFETGIGAWSIPGAPTGSDANTSDWVQRGTLFIPSAGVSTEDSILLGFGLEHVEDPAVRARLLERVLDHLNPSGSPHNSPCVASPDEGWLRTVIKLRVPCGTL